MKETKIVFAGIPRAGSTLLWQIFTQIVPYTKQFKRTTPFAWEPEKDVCMLSTIRHPYDLMASKYTLRKRRAENQKTEWNELAAINGVCGHVMKSFNGLKDVISVYKNYTIFRYENFLHDFTCFYEAIELLFKVKVDERKRKEINKKCGLEENRKRCATKEGADKNWKEFWLYKNHINSPEPGAWKRIIPKKYHQIVKNRLGVVCEEWNYEK